MSLALQEGSIFADRYRVVRRIATGGMGAVYEVVHRETERHRALKVMLPHIVQSPEHRERFKREAKVAAYIKSEYIVDVFDAGIDEATGMPFLVMELLEGEELSARLARTGRLPPEEVLIYLHQTAMALDKTHQASIVHRDLKPQNLFLTAYEDGTPRIKVLDFGIAKILATGANGATTTTFGTPLYMSPEQFVTDTGLSPASDIFALGMIAYTLVVGRSYWSADTEQRKNVIAFALVASRGPQEPASVRAAERGVPLPPGFDAWFAKVTAFNPSARFPSATTAVAALAEVFGFPPPLIRTGNWQRFTGGALPQVPVPATPLPTPAGIANTGVPVRRGSSPLVWTAAFMGLLTVAGGFYLIRSSSSGPAAPMDRGSAAADAETSAAPAATGPPLAVASVASVAVPAAEPTASASAPKPTPSATSQTAPVQRPLGNPRRPRKYTRD
jgi:eukaryotic-like serine/threonine-protein kinase